LVTAELESLQLRPLIDSSFGINHGSLSAFLSEMRLILAMPRALSSQRMEQLQDDVPDILILSLSTFQAVVREYGASSKEATSSMDVLNLVLTSFMEEVEVLQPSRVVTHTLLVPPVKSLATPLATRGRELLQQGQ
jgi:hypothetical protein